MNETEVERLVVRLVGDGSQYQKMLQTAQQDTMRAAGVIDQASKRIEGFRGSLTGFGTSVLGALAGYGLATTLQAAFESFTKSEHGLIKLTTAIEANGASVEYLIPLYTDYARVIDEATGVNKGETFALLRQAAVLGLTGEAAKNAATNAIGLAAAMDMDASSAIRMTVALEQGNVAFLRRILRLRENITDEQVMDKAMLMINAGLKQEEAILKTVGGQLNELGKAFKGLSKSVGGVVAEMIKPLVGFMTAFAKWFADMDDGSKKVVVAVTAITIALLTLPSILYVLDPLIQLFSFFTGTIFKVVVPLIFLSAKFVLLTGVILVWKAALLMGILLMGTFAAVQLAWSALVAASAAAPALVTAALLILKSVMLLLVAVYAAFTVGNVVYIGQMLLAKVATWLFNAALTVTHFLLTGGISLIVAFGVAVALLTGAFVLVGAAAFAVWKTIKGLFQALTSMSTDIGPLVAIGDMFVEWYGILRSVVSAAQVDLPLAWQLLKAGATLAIEQVKALLPPLWEFIKDGFEAVWKFVGESLTIQFKLGLRNSLSGLAGSLFSWIPGFTAVLNATMGLLNAPLDQMQRGAASQLEQSLEAASRAFDIALRLGATEAMTEARTEIQRIRDELDRLHPGWNSPLQATRGVVNNLKDANKELEKFESVLFGSAEAFRRVYAFRQMMAAGTGTPGPGMPAMAGGRQSGQVLVPSMLQVSPVQNVLQGGGGNPVNNTLVLTQMRDFLKDIAELMSGGNVMVVGAGLRGG